MDATKQALQARFDALGAALAKELALSTPIPLLAGDLAKAPSAGLLAEPWSNDVQCGLFAPFFGLVAWLRQSEKARATFTESVRQITLSIAQTASVDHKIGNNFYQITFAAGTGALEIKVKPDGIGRMKEGWGPKIDAAMALGVKDALIANLIAAVPAPHAEMLPIEVEDYKKANAALALSVIRFSTETAAPAVIPIEINWSFLLEGPVKAMDRDSRKSLPTRLVRAIDNGLFWPGDGLSSLLMAAPTAAVIFHSMVHKVNVSIATDNNIVADKVGAAHYSLVVNQATNSIDVRLKLNSVANSDAWGPKFQAATGLRAVDEAVARDQLKPFDEAAEKYSSQAAHPVTFELDFQSIFDTAQLQNKDRNAKKEVFTKLLRDVQRGLYGVGGLDAVAFSKANAAAYINAVHHIVVKLAATVVPRVGQDGLALDYDVNTRRLIASIKPEFSGKLDGWKAKLDALLPSFSGAPAAPGFVVHPIPVWQVIAPPPEQAVATVAARGSSITTVVMPVMPAATPTPTAVPQPAAVAPQPAAVKAPVVTPAPTPAPAALVATATPAKQAAPVAVARPAVAPVSLPSGTSAIDTSILNLPTLPPPSASPLADIPAGDDADVQAVNEKVAALTTRLSTESQAPGLMLVDINWDFLNAAPIKSKTPADRKTLINKIPKAVENGLFWPNDGLAGMLVAAPRAAAVFHSKANKITIGVITDGKVTPGPVGGQFYEVNYDASSNSLVIRIKMESLSMSDAWGIKIDHTLGLKAMDERVMREQKKPTEDINKKYNDATQHNLLLELDWNAITAHAAFAGKDRNTKNALVASILKDVGKGLTGLSGMDMSSFFKNNSALRDNVKHLVVSISTAVAPKAGSAGYQIDYVAAQRRLNVAFKADFLGKNDAWKAKLDAISAQMNVPFDPSVELQPLPLHPLLCDPATVASISGSSAASAQFETISAAEAQKLVAASAARFNEELGRTNIAVDVDWAFTSNPAFKAQAESKQNMFNAAVAHDVEKALVGEPDGLSALLRETENAKKQFLATIAKITVRFTDAAIDKPGPGAAYYGIFFDAPSKTLELRVQLKFVGFVDAVGVKADLAAGLNAVDEIAIREGSASVAEITQAYVAQTGHNIPIVVDWQSITTAPAVKSRDRESRKKLILAVIQRDLKAGVAGSAGSDLAAFVNANKAFAVAAIQRIAVYVATRVISRAGNQFYELSYDGAGTLEFVVRADGIGSCDGWKSKLALLVDDMKAAAASPVSVPFEITTKVHSTFAGLDHLVYSAALELQRTVDRAQRYMSSAVGRAFPITLDWSFLTSDAFKTSAVPSQKSRLERFAAQFDVFITSATGLPVKAKEPLIKQRLAERLQGISFTVDPTSGITGGYSIDAPVPFPSLVSVKVNLAALDGGALNSLGDKVETILDVAATLAVRTQQARVEEARLKLANFVGVPSFQVVVEWEPLIASHAFTSLVPAEQQARLKLLGDRVFAHISGEESAKSIYGQAKQDDLIKQAIVEKVNTFVFTVDPSSKVKVVTEDYTQYWDLHHDANAKVITFTLNLANLRDEMGVFNDRLHRIWNVRGAQAQRQIASSIATIESNLQAAFSKQIPFEIDWKDLMNSIAWSDLDLNTQKTRLQQIAKVATHCIFEDGSAMTKKATAVAVAKQAVLDKVNKIVYRIDPNKDKTNLQGHNFYHVTHDIDDKVLTITVFFNSLATYMSSNFWPKLSAALELDGVVAEDTNKAIMEKARARLREVFGPNAKLRISWDQFLGTQNWFDAGQSATLAYAQRVIVNTLDVVDIIATTIGASMFPIAKGGLESFVYTMNTNTSECKCRVAFDPIVQNTLTWTSSFFTCSTPREEFDGTFKHAAGESALIAAAFLVARGKALQTFAKYSVELQKAFKVAEPVVITTQWPAIVEGINKKSAALIATNVENIVSNVERFLGMSFVSSLSSLATRNPVYAKAIGSRIARVFVDVSHSITTDYTSELDVDNAELSIVLRPVDLKKVFTPIAMEVMFASMFDVAIPASRWDVEQELPVFQQRISAALGVPTFTMDFDWSFLNYPLFQNTKDNAAEIVRVLRGASRLLVGTLAIGFESACSNPVAKKALQQYIKKIEIRLDDGAEQRDPGTVFEKAKGIVAVDSNLQSVQSPPVIRFKEVLEDLFGLIVPIAKSEAAVTIAELTARFTKLTGGKAVQVESDYPLFVESAELQSRKPTEINDFINGVPKILGFHILSQVETFLANPLAKEAFAKTVNKILLCPDPSQTAGSTDQITLMLKDGVLRFFTDFTTTLNPANVDLLLALQDVFGLIVPIAQYDIKSEFDRIVTQLGHDVKKSIPIDVDLTTFINDPLFKKLSSCVRRTITTHAFTFLGALLLGANGCGRTCDWAESSAAVNQKFKKVIAQLKMSHGAGQNLTYDASSGAITVVYGPDSKANGCWQVFEQLLELRPIRTAAAKAAVDLKVSNVARSIAQSIGKSADDAAANITVDWSKLLTNPRLATDPGYIETFAEIGKDACHLLVDEPNMGTLYKQGGDYQYEMNKIKKISIFINLAGCNVSRGLYVPTGFSAHKEGDTLVLETRFPAPGEGIGEVVEWELTPTIAKRKEEDETARLEEIARQRRIQQRQSEIAAAHRENESRQRDHQRERERYQRDLQKWHESATLQCIHCKGKRQYKHSGCSGRGVWGVRMNNKCLGCKGTGWCDCGPCNATGLKYRGKHDGNMPREPAPPRLVPIPAEIFD